MSELAIAVITMLVRETAPRILAAINQGIDPAAVIPADMISYESLSLIRALAREDAEVLARFPPASQK